MKYRIFATLGLLVVLAVMAFVMAGGSTTSTPTSQDNGLSLGN